MKKAFIVAFVGLVLVASGSAEPLVKGRVRLSSGEAAAAAQVIVFDLAALQRGPVAQATTDADGYFALPLAALGGQALPQGFALGQNYPNPFNPSTVIPYQLPTAAHVRLDVFNVLGQQMATLVNEERPAGVHTAVWNATNAAGQAVAAGVYIYRLRGAGVELTRRMVLVDGQAGMAATVLPASGGEALGSAVGATSEPSERTYGLVVSGVGVVPYVDAAFKVRAGMAPVEFVVESMEELPRGKALACGILGDVNNDGQVDLADALLVVVFNLDPSITAPNNGNMGLGDVTDDGTVNLTDLLAIMTYITNPSDAFLPMGIGQSATRVNWVAGPIRQLTNDAGVGFDANPVWSYSGEYIYFKSSGFDEFEVFGEDGDPGIYSIEVNDRRFSFPYLDKISPSEHHGMPVWSPDGRHFAFDFEYDGNRDIYVQDNETEADAVRRLTDNSEADHSPTWSPDGTQIVFVSDRSGNWDIYVMDADGEDEYLRRLTDTSESEFGWGHGARNPAWSPDGKYIAYESGGSIYAEIYLMDADGSNVRLLMGGGVNPTWSPDGKYIAYESRTGGNIRSPDILVMDADGSNNYLLTHYDGYDGEPAWSPDGTQIAFVSYRDGDLNIYVMDLLGSCE